MMLLVDVKDKKAKLLKELLEDLPYVKVKVITKKEAKFLLNFKKSIDEVKLAQAGKKKLQSAKEMLKEL